MLVKAGSLTYDSRREPILLVLDDKNKLQISHMLMEDYLYCVAPNICRPQQLKEFMKLDNLERHVPRHMKHLTLKQENDELRLLLHNILSDKRLSEEVKKEYVVKVAEIVYK